MQPQTRVELIRTLRWGFALTLGGYVALTALATIDPKYVHPFVDPSWLLVSAIVVGGLLALLRPPAAGSVARARWFPFALGLAFALLLMPGLLRDHLSWVAAVGAGFFAALFWWLVDRPSEPV